MTSLSGIRSDFVQLWGRLGPCWGIPPATARVHAYLLSQADPVDAATIQRELGTSRGSVSMACRELADWGLVVAEHRPGERRQLYRAEDDPALVIRGIVATRKRREWDPLLQEVDRWRAELSGERSRDAVVLRDRLGEIAGLVSLVDRIADSFLRGGTVPRLGLTGLIAMARKQPTET